MRIGVNALYLIPGGVGGTEIYLRCLLEALAKVDQDNEYFLFVNRETGAELAPAAGRFICCPQPVKARLRPMRLLWEQAALPLVAGSRKVDVLFNPGFTTPAFAPAATVTVFHDLQHLRYPEFFRWFDLPFWKFFLWQAAHTSTRLLAVSEATRDDLLRFYSIRSSKVRVIPHGVEETFFEIARRRQEIGAEPFLLAVSTLHPHKNLPRLLRAFRAVREHLPEYRLVVAGLFGFQTEAIRQQIKNLELEDAVELTGWVSRERLRELYLKAHAFVSPTLFEGFGMPVLEALASGLPVACSGIEPLKSIAGEAALFFDPLDEAAIADALVRIACDQRLRQQLSQAGLERARSFRWEDTARRTLELIAEAAAVRAG